MSRLARDGRFDSFPSPPLLDGDAPSDGRHRHPALHRGSRLHPFEPTAEVAELAELVRQGRLERSPRRRYPRVGRDVRDRVVAREVLFVTESRLENLQDPDRLADEP